jgi:hypothetical protein
VEITSGVQVHYGEMYFTESKGIQYQKDRSRLGVKGAAFPGAESKSELI